MSVVLYVWRATRTMDVVCIPYGMSLMLGVFKEPYTYLTFLFLMSTLNLLRDAVLLRRNRRTCLSLHQRCIQSRPFYTLLHRPRALILLDALLLLATHTCSLSAGLFGEILSYTHRDPAIGLFEHIFKDSGRSFAKHPCRLRWIFWSKLPRPSLCVHVLRSITKYVPCSSPDR